MYYLTNNRLSLSLSVPSLSLSQTSLLNPTNITENVCRKEKKQGGGGGGKGKWNDLDDGSMDDDGN